MQRLNETVGVIGLGYVGLPLALAMVDAGYDVVGVDINEDRVAKLRAGNSYVTDVSNEELQARLDNIHFTTSYEALSDVVGVSICVPTPMKKTGQPDLGYVASAVDDLEEVLQPESTVVLESTVYPGATEELVAPKLSENGRALGEDIFVAFSPERIDPGREIGIAEIPKVIGGVTETCSDHAYALYEPVFNELVRVSSSTEAELVKLLENTFRAVNIGMINEIAVIAHELDVDVWDVVDAASTKPFGFMPFYPGPGLGGHCIPVDPLYLSWKAGQQGIRTQFIDLADQINREMPDHVIHRVTDLLNNSGLALSQSKILLAGVAYKANVSDVRESPAYDIIGLLDDRQAEIAYHDPHVEEFIVNGETYESVPLSKQQIENSDCVIILAGHDKIDFELIADKAPMVFDTRNVMADSDANSIYTL